MDIGAEHTVRKRQSPEFLLSPARSGISVDGGIETAGQLPVFCLFFRKQVNQARDESRWCGRTGRTAFPQ